MLGFVLNLLRFSQESVKRLPYRQDSFDSSSNLTSPSSNLRAPISEFKILITVQFSSIINNNLICFKANISIKRDASPKAHAKKPYEAIKNQDEDDEPLIYEEDRKVGNKINENSPKPKDFKVKTDQING